MQIKDVVLLDNIKERIEYDIKLLLEAHTPEFLINQLLAKNFKIPLRQAINLTDNFINERNQKLKDDINFCIKKIS